MVEKSKKELPTDFTMPKAKKPEPPKEEAFDMDYEIDEEPDSEEFDEGEEEGEEEEQEEGQ